MKYFYHAKKSNKFNSHGINYIVIFFMVFLFGCKERTLEVDLDQSNENLLSKKNDDVGNSSDQPVGDEVGSTTSSSTYDQFHPSLKEAFSRMRNEGQTFPVMLKAWTDIWQGQFDEPAEENSISSIRLQAPDSILALLRSGGTLQGFERTDLAGIFGVYVGWANDPNLSGQLYHLFRKRSDAMPLSEGDAVIAVLSDEIIDTIEPPVHFEKEDEEGWMKVAQGKNPVYRRIALKFHERLYSNIDVRESFLKLYSHEAESNIKEEALSQINRLQGEPRKRLLGIFRDGQSTIGDLDFSRKIQAAMDQ